MGQVAFSVLSVLVWIIVISAFVSVLGQARKKRKTIAADGHMIPPEKDVTCEGRDGHRHPKPTAKQQADYGPRYIVHDDPEMGYVILNGVKRKISECKDL